MQESCLRKYKFLSNSPDPRPLKHSTNWYVYGMQKISGKPHHMIVVVLEKDQDLYAYYPEAINVELMLTGNYEVVRGGELNVLNQLRSYDFSSDSFMDKSCSPTFLFIVANLSAIGLSDRKIARRLGVTYKRWLELKEREDVSMAMSGSYEEYLSRLSI